MKDRIINIIKIVVILICFFYLNDFIYLITGINPENMELSSKCLLSFGIDIVLCLLIFAMYKETFIKDFKKFKKGAKNISLTFKYLCIFFVTKFGSAFVSSILFTIFGITEVISENQQGIQNMVSSGPILMLISASIFAPIIEEGIFRLGLKKIITNKYLFIAISGFVFGLMHVFPTDINLTQALITSVSYVAIGVVLAYIYEKEDNIYFSIIIHGINNLVAMIMLLFMI